MAFVSFQNVSKVYKKMCIRDRYYYEEEQTEDHGEKY